MSKLIASLALLGVTAVLVAGGAFAAQGGAQRWAPSTGPQGGSALAVAVAPSAPQTMYVGTGRGIFRSENRGQTWVSAGLAERPGAFNSSPPPVMSLAVDP